MAAVSRPYGLWPSPITPRSLAQGLRLGDVQWDSDGQTLVWYEGRGDRGVLVAATGGEAPRDLTGPERSVRARIGYGGGDFTVAQGSVYFAGPEGRLYRQPLIHGPAQPITPGFGAAAAPAASLDGRWVLYVHSYERRDCIALVDSEGQRWPQQLISGDDFYMQPVWHPSGRQIAWVSWNHPQMPWDGCRLFVGSLEEQTDGLLRLSEFRHIAGDEQTAVFQPAFSPDGRSLAFVSDEDGYGQLYLLDLETNQRRQLTDGPFDLAEPAWVQGMRSFGFSADSSLIFYLRNGAGFRSLWSCNLATGESQAVGGEELATSYTWLTQPAIAPNGAGLALIGSGPVTPTRVIAVDSEGHVLVQRRSGDEQVAPEELSQPQPVSWPGPDGNSVHGIFYPPASGRFVSAGLPPAIVRVHGGPTAQATAGYSPGVQFFTTRGFAVLEVNHRGSSGYGRAYMDLLQGQWGVCDVEDAAGGARFLADTGRADSDRLVVMGGSAGGFTVLGALIAFPGLFRAGLCLYGVSNLFTLASDTHKFEERYLDGIVGPLPEAAALYRERSPIFAADNIVDPIAIFQGEDDEVVPRDQSDAIVASLRARGVPYEYHLYPGEGHGWRKPETVAAFYEAVDAFLKRFVIFG